MLEVTSTDRHDKYTLMWWTSYYVMCLVPHGATTTTATTAMHARGNLTCLVSTMSTKAGWVVDTIRWVEGVIQIRREKIEEEA